MKLKFLINQNVWSERLLKIVLELNENETYSIKSPMIRQVADKVIITKRPVIPIPAVKYEGDK